jgi:hypothetical protein
MPFSESLAARIRDMLVRRTDIAEQKMFGGLCFLLRGNILVGVRRDSLIARLGEAEASEALKKSYVTQMGTRRPIVFYKWHGYATSLGERLGWRKAALSDVQAAVLAFAELLPYLL